MFVEDVHAKYSVCATQVDAGREVCLEKRVLSGMLDWVLSEVQNKDHGKTTWEFSHQRSFL